MPRSRRPWKRLPRRLQVFVPALVVLLLAATGLTLLVALKTFVFSPALLVFWGSVLSGPFAGLWVLPQQAGWVWIGAVNLLLMFAHPVRPHLSSAITTLVGFALWFFCGMAVSFSPI